MEDLITESLIVNTTSLIYSNDIILKLNVPVTICTFTFKNPVNYVKMTGGICFRGNYGVSMLTDIYLSTTPTTAHNFNFCPKSIAGIIGSDPDFNTKLWEASNIYAYSAIPFTKCYINANVLTSSYAGTIQTFIQGSAIEITNDIINTIAILPSRAIIYGVATQ